MRDFKNRIEALKDFIGNPKAKIKANFDKDDFVIEIGSTFSVGNEEYLVVNESEAERLAEEDVENLLDEIGLECLSPEAQEYAMSECSTWDWEEAIREDAYNYASDIADESGENGYASRLVEEAVDEGVIDEDECEENEEGELDYKGDDLVDRFAEWKADRDKSDYSSAGEYLEGIYGSHWASECTWLKDFIHYPTLAKWIVEQDGAANSLARYDGRENEGTDSEGNTWYIYRVD